MSDAYAWYCQRDGGQWNVRCEVVHELGSLVVIRAKDHLVGTLHEDGMQYLIVPARDVHKEAQ
jgi:hypothetical protein